MGSRPAPRADWPRVFAAIGKNVGMAGTGERVIKCRCDRRHPEGTEWCPCGAYLPHDGELVDAPVAAVAPNATPAEPIPAPPDPSIETGVEVEALASDAAPAGPAPAAAFDPTKVVETQSAKRHDKMIRNAQPATKFEPDKRRTAYDDSPEYERAARADDLVCPECYERNDADRVFCATCGHKLRTDFEEDYEQQFSWWQKLVARVKGQDLKSSAMNAKYQVRRVKGLSTRARMFRTALLGGALGAVGIGFVPGLRSEVMNRAKDISLPDRYSFVEVQEVSSTARIIDGWNPEYVLDLSTNRAWGAEWQIDGSGFVPPEGFTECVDAQRYPTMRFALNDTGDVDRIRVWAGTWENDPIRPQRPQPRLVQVKGVDASGVESGECQFHALDSSVDAQSIDVKLSDVAAVDLSIVAIEPGDGSTSVVALSEVWLENER